MAAVALGGGLDMTGGFAGSLAAVMATVAGTTDTGVIEPRRTPGACGMTGVALFGGGNMAGMLAAGLTAIVTAAAGSGHRGMVHPAHPLEHQGVVTGLAVTAGVDVAGILALGHYAVMTLAAGSGHAAMIKPGRRHGNGGMAVIATVTAGNVIGRLADGNDAVVTACTVTGRSLEQTLAMAARTFHNLVGPGQDVTGSKMIKVIPGLRCRYSLPGEQQQQNEYVFSIPCAFHFLLPVDCCRHILHRLPVISISPKSLVLWHCWQLRPKPPLWISSSR